MSNEILRKLKLKTASCERIAKEASYYEDEARQQQVKIDGMIQENADEYDIRKQKEVKEESVAMIADSRKRLNDSSVDLKEYMDANCSSLAADSEMIVRANKAIDDSKRFLEKNE